MFAMCDTVTEAQVQAHIEANLSPELMKMALGNPALRAALRECTAENASRKWVARCERTEGEGCPDPLFVHVTAYSVTQHYGGPEEGGWWYHWREPVESVKVRRGDDAAIEAAKAALMAEHGVEKEARDWAGAHDYEEAFAEDFPGESRSTERPGYC